MENKEGAVFIGQLHDVRTKADGGGRMTIDFGADGLEEIQWAQKMAAKTRNSFQIALVPLPFTQVGEERIDLETGEVLL